MKEKNGITLIALIITIIVMLILVAVTISMAINGGLFGYAGNAAKDTEKAKQDEQKLDEGKIEVGGQYYGSLDDYLQGTPTETFSSIYTARTEYKENGVTTAYIPKGFAVGTSPGINRVADGLVIQDDEGNQFVWIPVSVSGSTTSEKEAAFDAKRTTKSNSNFSEVVSGNTSEYSDMRTSVINNGGFYIARYEAGYPTGRTTSVTSVAAKPLSKKGVYPYNNLDVYNAMSRCRNMYTDTTKYGVKGNLCYGVQWDLMLEFLDKQNETDSRYWGNFKTSESFDFEGEYYTLSGNQWMNDSTTKSYNSAMLLQTGATTRNKLKNLYDIAGNVSEWTMEKEVNYSSTYQVVRGGSYILTGSGDDDYKYYNPMYRGSSYHTSYSCNVGFRPALYILSE